ncbi:cytochrome P450 [Nocardia panacis]|uniref:Cytochrome P450 n=1 Tax=Nocardia panacis TaxID=2340916 RepID=A0A3A4JRV8_9NOCA|nr:cytochrome P450 [Nocardia panacis]RJO68421.1 cytochrome P450 [Nocardia panacis]
MSTPQSQGWGNACPVTHGSPTVSDEPRIPMYSPEFAADPHRFYREMRRKYGSLAPIELSPGVPATLVVGYRTALQILNDPDHFPADPRAWQQDIPADCPVLPMMGWRPLASRSAGTDFLRYRQATTAAIGQVDLFALHDIVEEIAIPLVNTFCERGKADLLQQYVFPLVFQVMLNVLGCTPEIGQSVAAGIAAVVEGIDAEKGNRMMLDGLAELVALKQSEPRADITSAFIAHPTRLNDDELVNQVSQIFGPGIEFLTNLINNTLLLILTDDRFGGSVLGGNLSTREALDEVLFNDPPLANLLTTYPRQPVFIDEVWLPAHQPVLISMAACNNDPAIRTEQAGSNRAHLAWGVGPHTCPAQAMAYLIAQDAIDQLLDALPEVRLDTAAEQPAWRPGPFSRALTGLPVRFPATTPLIAPPPHSVAGA